MRFAAGNQVGGGIMGCALHASIIITNYNYGRFLRECIDSALNQTYPNTEVVVVDDGSSDDSREIIAGYSDRIVPVLKANGGMGSAFNAGFAVSSGEVVCFLDADDTLLPAAIQRAVDVFIRQGVAKVHWPLQIVDEQGRETGVYPTQSLPHGDLRESVIRDGEMGYVWPMTSGNAWARDFLESLFPVPEDEYRSSAESYLATLAPAFGPVGRLLEPMSTYRMHGHSLSNRKLVSEYIKNSFRHRVALWNGFRKMRIDVNTELWPPSAESLHQILLACEDLTGLIPSGSSFIFVEWDQWGPGQIVAGCRAIPFLERDGRYWGKPLDDLTAIQEIERLRRAGASFMVFGWPAFWWLDYYSDLHRHLRSEFRCVLENERLVVFDLRR